LLTEIKVGAYSGQFHMRLTSVAFVEVMLECEVSQLSYWHWSESCYDARTV